MASIYRNGRRTCCLRLYISCMIPVVAQKTGMICSPTSGQRINTIQGELANGNVAAGGSHVSSSGQVPGRFRRVRIYERCSTQYLHVHNTMKLKEIHRTSTFAWSPTAPLPLLATGSVAGALDESFSNESQLEIWAPNFLDKDEYELGGIGQNAPAGFVTDGAR